MIQTIPLALPDSLVDLHRIDLSALYSTGWGVRAHDLAGAANGDVYALFGVNRYRSYGTAGDRSDPAHANFRYRVINRYSPDGEVLASAVWDPAPVDGAASAVAEGGDMTLCVLPDGVLAVSACPDNTTLIAPDLSRVIATYRSHDQRPFKEYEPGDAYASSLGVTPSGRLLCSVSEYGVWRYGSPLTNIVGVADGALTAASRPQITAIASLDPEPARHSEVDLRPHVAYQGTPIGLANRPRPALTELVAGEDRLSGWDDSRLGRPAVMADDLFVVPFFAKTFRGGSRGRPFTFALVTDRGEMTGRLHGLHEWRDSPFTGFCFNVTADARRGHAFHLNRYGLYAWNRAGMLRARLDTESKTFKPLTHFTLHSCSPTGELLLIHNKQHLILRISVPADLTDLAATVEAALRTYARQRTALKKQETPVNWHWTRTAVLHHL
ncbi:hypothetical protein MOV08_39615 [Streptomyces yunnanensis]|uniref:Uncharacterized protein n=1 Tax=Streptomyces yunnanensis TaxID=156453 RepID=A0ABY8AMI1_9ACTN|nr:hypothetical protein [Streptomyces yunnanensis]WEB44792.1 hypothetical protein MOV08_39615 [Streptomyces yunnanensis]